MDIKKDNLKKKFYLYYFFFYFFIFTLFFSFLSYTIPLYKIICGLDLINYISLLNLLENSFFYYLFNSFYIEFNYFFFFFYINGFFFSLFFFFNLTLTSFLNSTLITSFFSNEILQIILFTKNSIPKFLLFNTLQYKLFLFKSELSLIFFRIYNKLNSSFSCFSVYVIFPTFYFSYINKLQCFCFDIINIYPYEIIDLPVVFYFLNDETLKLSNLTCLISITYLLFATYYI